MNDDDSLVVILLMLAIGLLVTSTVDGFRGLAIPGLILMVGAAVRGAMLPLGR